MFKENSDGKPDTDLSEVAVMAAPAQVKLSEEDAVYLTGNWNLMVAYSLIGLKGFVLSPESLKMKMNISTDEAVVIIETLNSMGLIKKNSDGSIFPGEALFFDGGDVPVSDVLNNNIKIKKQILDRLVSKDVFGFQFDVLSKSVVDKYFFEFYGLIQKMAEESKGKDDCEVYGFDFSFAKATGSRKGIK